MMTGMNESFDQSHLDQKYFIDETKYNCPFCNRRSITYGVIGKLSFDWSNGKVVYGYLVTCGGDTCRKTSFHLSDQEIVLSSNKFLKTTFKLGREDKTIYVSDLELDKLFFLQQPTTFFTLDNRINEKIRKLVSEAEGSAKMNYLVGASGCLRKAIYELLDLERVPKIDGEGKKIDYGDRVKTLKNKYQAVPSEYFDALANIQGMASEQLHEGDWKPWIQSEFNFLVETVKEVLTEIYVRPKEKASILQKILALKSQKSETKEAIK